MDKAIQNLIKKAETQAKGVTFLNTPDQLKDFYLSGLDRYTEWRALASIDDWLPVDREFLQDFRLKLDERKIATRVIMKSSGLQFEPTGFAAPLRKGNPRLLHLQKQYRHSRRQNSRHESAYVGARSSY